MLHLAVFNEMDGMQVSSPSLQGYDSWSLNPVVFLTHRLPPPVQLECRSMLVLTSDDVNKFNFVSLSIGLSLIYYKDRIFLRLLVQQF